MIVFLRPQQLQIAAERMGSDLAMGSASQDAGDSDGTRARAARQRFAGAALPDAEGHVVGTIDLDEFDVGLAWKESVLFDLWTDGLNVLIGDRLHEDDAMRISHRDAGCLEFAPRQW